MKAVLLLLANPENRETTCQILILSYETYELTELHTLQRHLPYLALIFASISGVIVVASLNLALASGVLSLFTVGDPLSIAFSRFLIPQSGFTVNVLLNDSVAMAYLLYFNIEEWISRPI